MGNTILPKQDVDENVWELAKQRVHRIYDIFDHVSVAFSGGKDSTALLHVTLEVARERGRLPLRVVHFDEEAVALQTERYVRRVYERDDVDLEWYCLELRHRCATSRREPWWYTWDSEKREKWVRDLPPEGITELEGFRPRQMLPQHVMTLLYDAEEHGRPVTLVGIRADESLLRRSSVSRRQEDNYIWPDPDGPGWTYKAAPIYDWSTQDVWTAPRVFGWDYNRAYDAMDKAGITPHMQRVAPPFGEEPLQNLWMWRECFPEIWRRLVNRVPGANAAMRWARSEIYGFGGEPEPPEGMTWPEFVRHFIGKYPPVEQRKIAANIKQKIQAHYKKTNDPILANAKHPETGISWEYLAYCASKGDLKGRTVTRYPASEEQAEKWWEKYNAELEVNGIPEGT